MCDISTLLLVLMQTTYLREQLNVVAHVVAVSNSRKMVLSQVPLQDADWQAALAEVRATGHTGGRSQHTMAPCQRPNSNLSSRALSSRAAAHAVVTTNWQNTLLHFDHSSDYYAPAAHSLQQGVLAGLCPCPSACMLPCPLHTL